MQNRRAQKAARTRAKNARFRANKAKEGSAAELSEQATIKKRASAYRAMENSVWDISRAAMLAMKVFDDDQLFLFAVGQLDFMVQRFRERYYALDFPL
jgi:hypothetical protein